MLTKEEFVAAAFRIAGEMSNEAEWKNHIVAVDENHIFFKNKKKLTAEKLNQMWPELLRTNISKAFANSVIATATKNQSSVNVPMMEIIRRIHGK
ncbi:hypothetical protein [Pseudomonas sp. 18058]|uniref:hypothetical protein n=1 Tax=Pseudomonas sp. 18058 TaxID=2681406 RepID=UPI00135B5E8D|nr:hypothetical protein [Pseudomonas sp. 18058]